jgi:HAD superfamily hydrolase (TIGR01509 family)
LTRPRPGREVPQLAATIDFWHTIALPDRSAIQKVEEARFRVWRDAVARAGVPHALTDRQFAAFLRWCTREEKRGRAPSLRRQIDWIFRRTGARVDGGALARALDGSVLAAPIRPAPGCRTALRRLRASGFRIALVSNLIHESPAAVCRMLRRWHLLREFDTLLTSAEVPWSKPDPRIYRRALRRLGVAPRYAIHIGDLPLDVQGARAAGMAAAWLTIAPRPGEERGRQIRGVRRFGSWREISPGALRTTMAMAREERDRGE